MLTSIISAVFVVAVITTRPLAKAIGRIAEIISAKKEDKAARKAAMEKYLNTQILDIEH